MNTKLRVFWTHHTLKGGTSAIEHQYTKRKRADDFPEDTNPETAYAQIYENYGRIDPDAKPKPGALTPLAPSQYAIITGSRIVHDHERGTVETFEAHEQNLLSDEILRACQRRI